MSTISSKQQKRQSLLEPIAVLAILVLVLVLLALQPQAGNGSNIMSGTLGTSGRAAGAAINSTLSFTADQRYWDANCGHGWSSDASCEAIVLRAQSCTISAASPYCSEYEAYLQQFQHP